MLSTETIRVTLKNILHEYPCGLSGHHVYYHVDTGKTVFYLAPPTPANLELYERIETFQTKEAEEDEWIGVTSRFPWIRVHLSRVQRHYVGVNGIPPHSEDKEEKKETSGGNRGALLGSHGPDKEVL
uniref:Uncharacterized protein n=1 Tax=Caenorhabditis tropicalis TaxID=1561998 RepID=A0A1I7T355_9PELO